MSKHLSAKSTPRRSSSVKRAKSSGRSSTRSLGQGRSTSSSPGNAMPPILNGTMQPPKLKASLQKVLRLLQKHKDQRRLLLRELGISSSILDELEEDDTTTDPNLRELREFSSGARSSGQPYYYDQIPTLFTQRVARRFSLGFAKYGEGNWQKGLSDREFIRDLMNHLEEHWLNFKEEGNRGDDNLAAMAWAIACLMVTEALHPEVINSLIVYPEDSL